MPSQKSYNIEMGHYNYGYEGNPNAKGTETYQKQNEKNGIANLAFENDNNCNSVSEKKVVDDVETGEERQQWSNQAEFLLSCIAMSVGLGNIWRFPFTAYENGGGAFLIPYLIVLFLIGKPLYFLEMAIGQFSSYGSVKVWKMVPIVKGLGYGQMVGTIAVCSYYCVLMALTVFYFYSSFSDVLPWQQCDPDWGVNCTLPAVDDNETKPGYNFSTSEKFFKNTVLNYKEDGIADGIGLPDWKLTICLFISWFSIFLIIIKGVQSSGKVSYFTALFPYVVLITLLIRGCTLDGAGDGILYFITPQWEKLLTGKVWYAAVTQSFFSLGVGFGPVVMYSSYNPFRHPLGRDAFIISIMDTFTSLLAGCTIFAILGNLAYNLNLPVDKVVKSGAGLAFISYPEAISKFQYLPQLFAVLFFLMLFTLGVGSAVSLVSCVITIFCDQFPSWKRWLVTSVICTLGFLVGLVYVTPGGQYILTLVDHFGGNFVIFVMAIFEVVAISWIYGIGNICNDIEFMLGSRVNIYWKICWVFCIPVGLITILGYSFYGYENPKEEGNELPVAALAAGWILAAVALLQIPIWAVHSVMTRKQGSLMMNLKAAFQSTDEWGPKDPQIRQKWLQQKQQ